MPDPNAPAEVLHGDKVFTNDAGETVAVAPGYERDAIAQGFVPTETSYVANRGDIQALSGREAAAALSGSAYAKLVGERPHAQAVSADRKADLERSMAARAAQG